MEYGQDSEPNADVRFISSHIPVFSPTENSFPAGECNLVAAAPKYGRIFVACGTEIKVFDSKTLCEEAAGSALTTIDVGAQVTHVAASCDGLTLMVAILHQHLPHALFYEIRSLVPGCGEQMPLVSVSLAGSGGQVHAVAWNPMDPSSVAVAVSPSLLTVLTLKDDQVERKTEKIEARALGWSPKGKQLTVGLVDGTLKLFKPDLTAVRSIQRPPMDEAGAVLNITWFSNTEFFIGYTSSVEEGAQVIMYVNAPKAKEPKFVVYEYICNYNQGPRSPMFYPFFFPEWSLLCLLSSRAVAVAVLGRPAEGGEGWCEYEIDEGCVAAVHNVSITQETFPLGLAVDFTSQKTFTAKDNKVSGPCPVLCTLSTGGELNLFHIINGKSSVEPLAKPPESLPTTGCRTPEQFAGVSSYVVGKAVPPSLPTATPESKPAFLTPQPPLPSSTPAAPQKADTMTFNAPAPSSTSMSPSPLQGLTTPFKLPQTQPSPLTMSLFPKTEPPSTPFFNLQGTTEPPKPTLPTLPGLSAPASTTQKLPQTTTSQDFKFPIPQLSTSAAAPSTASIADTKPPAPVIPKVPEVTPPSVAAPPRPPQAVVAELNDTLLATIEAAKTNFERELQDHMTMGELPNQVGGQEEVGGLRCSLGETAQWVDEMSSTTAELKGEVGQLHSEVLEGFILAEEAQVIKSKNPRHRQMLQPQTLDPHSRKQMEEIRSLYQYLQSQLSEIDTRLHLDWAAYRNGQSKRRKKELPASETLYQALKKCHYARKVCERRVDALCDRIKDLHLHSLSGLAAPQAHQEDDEVLATLERSLRDTSISSPSFTSPFKMLSPGKQESLQKILSQRNFIPLRKCSNLPRMNLSSLEDLSAGHSQESSPRPSLTTSKAQSLLESFGPQTFSTPVRCSQSPESAPASSVSEATVKEEEEGEAATAPPPKPQYEDITPPQTPDNRLKQGTTKPASPLWALSRLVSEVPTTAPCETKAPGTALLAEGKTAFRGFGNGASSSGGVKAPVTVTSGPLQGAFKPVTSAPLSKTTLAFSFAQFAPPSVSSQSSVTQQPLSQSMAGGSTQLGKTPAAAAAAESTSFSQATSSDASQKTEVKSSLFFRPPATASESFSQFSVKPDTSAASQDKQLSAPGPCTALGESVSEAAGSSSAPGGMGVPQTSTTTHLAAVAETESTSSSSSTDSDTASNATVIGDSASTSAACGFPDGSEQPGERLGAPALGEEASPAPQPASTSQPSLFSAGSGSFFGGGSSSMFGGASSSSSGFFGTHTSVESGFLASSTTTASTTTTAITTTTSASSFFATPATVSGGFFASSVAAATCIFNASPKTPSVLFEAKTTASPSKTSAGADAGTVVPSGSLFGKTATATTAAETVASTSGGSIFSTTEVSSGGAALGTAATPTLGTAETPALGTAATPALGTAATPSGGIFGNSSASGSIFGGASATSGSTFGIAGNTSVSLFGGATTITPIATTTPSTTAATTAAAATVTTTAAPLFDNVGASTASVTILGTTTATAAAPASSTTVTATATATTASIFGGSNTATATTDSIFGASTAAAATTTSASIFGVKSTAGSIFGGSGTSGNLFGTTSTAATGSIFGTASAGTGSGSIFGTASTSGSIFGAAAQTSTATPSIFGSAASTAGNAGSLFGGNGSVLASTASTTTTTTTATITAASSSAPTLTTGLLSSLSGGESPPFSVPFTPASDSTSQATSAAPTLFSAQTTTSATGLSFTPGNILSTSATTSTSAFTSLATTSSAFTSPAASSVPSLTPSTTSSVFGRSTSGLVFGGTASPQNSLFGGGGQSTGTFGASQPSGSIFGGSGGQSLFGNTSTGSLFGQTSAASTSPFSSVNTSKTESSPFAGSSVFGSGGGGGGGGGGFFSGLGSKPSAENANKNVFGTASPLSSAAPQTNLFGNSSSSTSSPFQGSVFGGGSSSGTTGTGSFSGGGGPVANTGFAVTTPQSPGFSGGPTFGGSPSFGGSPTFGSPPVFGGSTFSSPLSSSSGGGFSSFASSSSATFGSLAGTSSSGAAAGGGGGGGGGTGGGFGSFASQGNTASFGSLAQQSTDQQAGGAFGSGGGAAFGSGGSFSSWR